MRDGRIDIKRTKPMPLSRLFDKLGVWSRAQAIVFARGRGFVS
jgi:hypothetical protein